MTDVPASGWEAPGRVRAGILTVLVFLYPATAATTVAGSAIYPLLLVAGLAWGRGWRRLESSEKQLLLGFVVAALVMAVAAARADEPWQGLQRLERYARIASIGFFYLVLRRYGLRPHRALGAGAWVATLVMAVQAGYQVVWRGDERAVGAYHHVLFGDLAVLWGCLAILYSLTFLRGPTAAAAAAVAAGASTYAAVLSLARGAWLFVPVAVLALALAPKRFRPPVPVPRWAAVLVVLAVAAVGLWQADRIVDRTREAVADVAGFSRDPTSGTSLMIRLNLWRNALLIAGEDPLLGAGLGNFHGRMVDMVEDGRSLSPWVTEYHHAHSIYLDPLASAGLLGLVATLVAYLLLPLRIFWGILPKIDSSDGRFCATAGALTVLAFATFGLSEALWFGNPFVDTYVVCIPVLLAGLPWRSPGSPDGPSSTTSTTRAKSSPR